MRWLSFQIAPRRAVSVSLGFVVLFFTASATQAGSRRGLSSLPPKVIRYDLKRDRLIHYESILAPAFPRPGSDTTYHGNRLTQFRFLGPRKRAGLYGVLDRYIEKHKFDPKKYQYRR